MVNPWYYIARGYFLSMGVLGFYRGIKYGLYKYGQLYRDVMYINTLFYGIYGSIVYIHPCMLPFTVSKELYRLEVHIRKLDHLKDSEYYNRIV